MADYQTILLDLDGDTGVAILTFNRTERANAVNQRCDLEIGAALDALQGDAAVRALIITGAGRHFCAGVDLRERGETEGGGATDVARTIYGRLAELPIPVIAAINGACMGAGCEIALRCDVRVMAEGATIGLPEIRFGALPSRGGTQLLPRLIGSSRAKELIFSGRHLSAEEAARWGLVNYVVPSDQLMGRARELAAEFVQGPAYALAAAKFLVNRAMDTDGETGLRLERQVVNTMASPEERAAERTRAAAGQDTYRNIFGKG
ncbi:MAG: enoyl-CoA hydratase/isomerase family protein [Dehalococcoidia bacterium]